MTYYNYLSEMQSFCFRAREALRVLKEDGLKDFYAAAEDGFYRSLEKVSVEDALKPINQSQIDTYLQTKAFTEEKEHEAAIKVREEDVKEFNEWVERKAAVEQEAVHE